MLLLQLLLSAVILCMAICITYSQQVMAKHGVVWANTSYLDTIEKLQNLLMAACVKKRMKTSYLFCALSFAKDLAILTSMEDLANSSVFAKSSKAHPQSHPQSHPLAVMAVMDMDINL